MRKMLCALAVLSVLLCGQCNESFAGSAEIAKEASLFFLGYSAGFVNHEIGHQLVATAKGQSMRWDIHTNYFNTKWTGEKVDQSVALGGFGAQILSTEIIMNSGINKKSSFVFGWLCYNTVNALTYTLKNELHGGNYKDFADIKNERAVGSVLAAHALLTAYRMYKGKEYPVWVGVGADQIVVGFKKRF